MFDDDDSDEDPFDDDDSDDDPFDDDELAGLADGIRARRNQVDERLVRRIESMAWQLRQRADKDPTLEPPESLQQTLWLLGWLMYEASWALTGRVKPAWGTLAPAEAQSSLDAHELILRLNTAYITMPWPHWGPRGLAVLRSAALSFSKKDTREGYVQAWQRHHEAQNRYMEYWESVQNAPERLTIGLSETYLQLRLAETGTACRVAERMLGRWDEDDLVVGEDDGDGPSPVQAMFDTLYTGSLSGSEALRIAEHIEGSYGLVHAVDVKRMAMVTGFRNPGIMTARAYLLMLPLTFALEQDITLPPADYPDWESARNGMYDAFVLAYDALEKEVRDDKDEFTAFSDDHLRSLAQLRLNLALIKPDTSLPCRVPNIDERLARDPLDEEAAEQLSTWLRDTSTAKVRNDANVIGAVVMPEYIRLVECMRRRAGVAPGGYLSWRRRWYDLDRYLHDNGRRALVDGALAEAELLLREHGC